MIVSWEQKNKITNMTDIQLRAVQASNTFLVPHTFYNGYIMGAEEERARQDVLLMQKLADTKQEFLEKLDVWCKTYLFNGTSCVETPFESTAELKENLFNFLNL